MSQEILACHLGPVDVQKPDSPLGALGGGVGVGTIGAGGGVVWEGVGSGVDTVLTSV